MFLKYMKLTIGGLLLRIVYELSSHRVFHLAISLVRSLARVKKKQQSFNVTREALLYCDLSPTTSFLKMLDESTNEQAYESISPASIVQTEMTNNEDIESTKMHVREEFVEILMSSNAARDSTKGIEPTKKQTKMIKAIEGRMNKLFTDKLNSEDAKSDDAIALAQSYLHISQIYSDVVWKDTLSEAYLLRSLGLLEGRETTRKAILTAMKVHNCLGRIYLDLKNPKRSLSFYEKAFLLYWTYTNKKDSYPAPIDILYVFGVVTREFQSGYSLDRQYMLTLSNLIQLHAHIDEQLYKPTTIIYEHMLLQKQVKLIPLTIGRAEWALKAALISKYLSTHNRFTEARSHLSIAFYMLNKFYRNEYKKIDGTKFPEMKTSLYNQYNSAAYYINMYAAQYGIALLRSSKDRLLKKFEKKDKQHETKSESLTTLEQKLPDLLVFTSTSNIEEEFNTWITDKYIVNYDDAKAVFLSVLKCLNDVWAYNIYTAYPDTQTNLLLEMSQACRYLAWYEQNGNQQLILHSWRLDILKNAIKLLNEDSKKYSEKLILLELAVTRVTALDIHLDELYFYQKSKPNLSPNINHYAKCALDNFQQYLDLAQ